MKFDTDLNASDYAQKGWTISVDGQKEITIDGSDHTLTGLESGGGSRFFSVTGGATVTLTFSSSNCDRCPGGGGVIKVAQSTRLLNTVTFYSCSIAFETGAVIFAQDSTLRLGVFKIGGTAEGQSPRRTR